MPNKAFCVGDTVLYTNPYHGFSDECVIMELCTSDDGLTARAYIIGELTRVKTNLTNLTTVHGENNL